METLYNVINNLRPGDSFDVLFPKGFELEYKRWGNPDTKTFVCSRLNAWYWDDDDHCKLDEYLYAEDSASWVCKIGDLTPESHHKLLYYLMSTPYDKK